MSIPQYAPRAEYIGAGNLAEYSFDFKISSASQVLVIVTDANYVETIRVRGDDVVDLVGIDFDSEEGGGAITLAVDLPAGHLLTILFDDNAPTQLTEFRNKSDFTLKRLEAMVDTQAAQIQKLNYLMLRSLKLKSSMNIADAADFNTELPMNTIDDLVEDNSGKTIVIGADNKSLELGPSIADAIASSTGLPVGGVQYDLLEKQTSTDGDADWTGPLVYNGISARFGSTLFTASGIKNILDTILQITYTAPTISLSGTGSGTIREKGTSLASAPLSASITKLSNDIAQVEFFRGVTSIDTQVAGGAIPSGGTSTYTDSTGWTDTISFSAKVTDIAGGGGPTTVTSNTVTYTFVYPYYSDAGAVGLTAAQVGALTKTLITSTATVNKTMTATGGQVLYFAYLASYGALTSILDVNGFETIGDWTLTTSNITGADATAQSYRIYSFNNPLTAGSYYYSFRR